MDALLEHAAAELRGHFGAVGQPPWPIRCSCGERFATRADHERHQAARVLHVAADSLEHQGIDLGIYSAVRWLRVTEPKSEE